MSKLPIVTAAGCLLVWDDSLGAQASEVAQWFDPHNPALAAQRVTQGGRGSAWFVHIQGQQGVLRYYRRGGWMGRVNPDVYLRVRTRFLRPFHEYHVLESLRKKGLPVARPLAACVSPVAGLFYRAALITQRIAGARALSDCRSESLWGKAGQTVAAMHQHGAWHADLNVHNILADAQDRIWLIDFDKARLEVKDPVVLANNLMRLRRSVNKVCPWAGSSHWAAFLRGYESVSHTPVS
jgi:3-deoxy-D-manno-octulosonic acid kinase